MVESRRNTLRTVSACLCLLATLMLYVPLAAAAAWSAQAMKCCNGNYCPIHGHHQGQPAGDPGCEHQKGEMAACSMNCCESPDKPVVTWGQAFILPPAGFVGAVPTTSRPAELLYSAELRRPSEPPSPPPRFVPVVL